MLSKRTRMILTFLDTAGWQSATQIGEAVYSARIQSTLNRLVALGLLLREKPQSRAGGKSIMYRITPSWREIADQIDNRDFERFMEMNRQCNEVRAAKKAARQAAKDVQIQRTRLSTNFVFHLGSA